MSYRLRLSAGLLLLVLSCLGLSVPAMAQPLAPYNLAGLAHINRGSTLQLSDFGSLPNSFGDASAIELLASAEPTPVLQAHSVIAPNEFANLFSRGQMTLSYQVMVSGPQAFVPVKVRAFGAVEGSASSGAAFVLQARWSLFFDESNPVAGNQIVTGSVTNGSFAESFEQVHEVSLIANLAYTVTMVVDTQVAGTEPGSQAEALARLDPFFSLGEGADPQAYGFVFSAGIGNAAPVPEPGPVGLLLAGLLGVGAWSRKVTHRR